MSWNIEDFLWDCQIAKRIWKPIIKRILTGRWTRLTLRAGEISLPSKLKKLGLYLHIPFCQSICPFCPYHRIKYEHRRFKRYEAALHQEIDLYARRLNTLYKNNDWPKIVSLYVGGGTPTIQPEALVRLLKHIETALGRADDICVELHPSFMDDPCLDLLKSAGVSMLSIGVESLSDRLLQLIGRSHNSQTAEDAVRRAVSKNFDSVNVDLMFSLPTQTLEELDSDLIRLLGMDIDQLSTYPIFGFPYSDLGREKGYKKIMRPKGSLIRSMLDKIRNQSHEQGFEQCAVWSFIRPGRKKFSSITRHHYLGLGASAASMTGRQFYVNTFSVEEYCRTLPFRLPVALILAMDRRLEMTYWWYWRFYELKIAKREFSDLFGEELGVNYGLVFSILSLLGMVEARNGSHFLTKNAAYWIHRLQNEYSLNYINSLWGKCRRDPWPEKVVL